ncbi:MAG: hypothetical protein ACM3JG_06145, partial [Thiohalocapsa sp.]
DLVRRRREADRPQRLAVPAADDRHGRQRGEIRRRARDGRRHGEGRRQRTKNSENGLSHTSNVSAMPAKAPSMSDMDTGFRRRTMWTYVGITAAK